MNSGLWFGLVLLPWTSACTHVILTCWDTCRDVGTIQHRQILQNVSLVCRNVKFQYLFFCDWVGPNPGWTSPVEQLREGHHRLFLKWDVPCMKHSLMLVSASAHIQQTDVSFVWSTYVSIHCIILHLINTSCVLSLKPCTHHISLHIIQSKACKTLWCTAASSSLSTVSPDAPAEQILLLIRLLPVLLLSSLGLRPPPSVSPSLPFSFSRYSVRFTAAFHGDGFMNEYQLQRLVLNKWLNSESGLRIKQWNYSGLEEKDDRRGKQEREMDGGGWMWSQWMCGCVDVWIWSPLTFCENMNKWSGDTVCVCIALLLFLSSRLLDGDLLFSDLLLHSLVHLFLHPFTWWII